MTDERDPPTADDPTAMEPVAGQFEGPRHLAGAHPGEGSPRPTPPPDEPALQDTTQPAGTGNTDTTVLAPNAGVTGNATDVDGPTVYGPTTGRELDDGPIPQNTTQPANAGGSETTVLPPTIDVASEATGVEGPTGYVSAGHQSDDEPTLQDTTRPAGAGGSETTVLAPNGGTVSEAAGAYGSTSYDPITGRESGDNLADETTAAVGTDDPTTTGPTVGGWPFEEFEPPPGELVWRAEAPPPPEAAAARHSPGYYVSLGAAVVLVVGLVALAAVVAVMRPSREVAGDASAWPVLPGTTTTTASQPPAPTATSQVGPFAEVAAHPLASSTTRMGDATCALPRFDPADDRQADFYAAAKVCADVAWREVLRQAGFDEVAVAVVTVTSATQAGSCGELAPTSAATQCDGVVYLTPAHLRDAEQNGRFPGRYLGVFLREYASALQYTTGLTDLVAAVPTGSAEDLDTLLAQQATCLAGVAAGAMAGRGAVDSNITGEIRARLSTVDAPPDAQVWLDKGFQQRTPAACNTWA